MTSPDSSLPATHFAQLVAHFENFDGSHRQTLAELYSAPGAEADVLAECWIAHPQRVADVVGEELASSVGWKIIEETALEHDLEVALDWATARQRREVRRLGLLDPTIDAHGRRIAVMPGALAAIFADRVRGQRASLPILLGRQSEAEVEAVADEWEISTAGSKVEVVLRISDYFRRNDVVDEVLDKLATPDWIGDALMVLELGGMCHWQQVYGYDLDENLERGSNVVPLMKGDERRQQRKVAETLMDMGVLFRLEAEQSEHPMIAVPEELWDGLWELGRRWLMDWTAQAVGVLDKAATKNGICAGDGPGLQQILKWWLCEVDDANLVYEPEHEDLAENTLRHLDAIYDGEPPFDWQQVWNLSRELRILEKEPYGLIGRGPEATTLLDGQRDQFVGECLLEWCLGYSGGGADADLGQAVGIDDSWRSRAVGLMKRYGEPIPIWMHQSGVDSATTGGGWLRQSGTGHDEMVLFEVGLTVSFVVMTKLLWLDSLTLLESGRSYAKNHLVGLMQCVAALSMFAQLRFVLEEQPAPIYLPFQRSSFLMDERQSGPMGDWVEAILERLLIPLAVASVDEQGRRVALDTSKLRIDDPPGWPEGQRQKWMQTIFGDDVDFTPPADDHQPSIRQVRPVSEANGARLAADTPVEKLLEAAKGRTIARFDGHYLEFES